MSARLSLPALLPSVATALLLWAPEAARGYAGSAQAEILIQCEAGPVLCAALTQALADHAGGAVVRPVPADGAGAPDRAGTLVRYHQEDSTGTRVRGHLSWQTGTGPATSGPSLGLTVMDHTIQDHMLRDFAELLVRNSGLPF